MRTPKDDKDKNKPAESPKPDDQKPPVTPPEPPEAPEPGEVVDEPTDEPAAPQTPPEPIKGTDDPLLKSLFSDLGEETEINKVDEQPPAPKASDTPPADKPPEDKKNEPAPPAAKKRKKTSSILEDEPVQQTAPVQPPPPPAAPRPPERPPEKDADEEYVKTLTEEQQDELAEVRRAEQMFPEKYKGRTKKLTDWYRSFDASATKLTEANPERTFDENDTEFQSLLKTKPRLDMVDVKKVQRAIMQDSVSEQMRKENESRFTEMERKTKEIEFKPKVEGVVDEFSNGLQSVLADDKAPYKDAAKLLKEKGLEAAVQEYPLEAAVIHDKIELGKNITREYTMIAKGVTKFDANNGMHRWILDYVNNQGQIFAAQGGKHRIQDGKSFLPRTEFAELSKTNPLQAAKHWTFSHRQIIEMIALNTQAEIENTIRSTEEQVKKMGFGRVPKINSPEPPKNEPEPLNPPRAKNSPSKAGTKQPPAKGKSDEPSGDPLDVVTTLRLKE